MKTIALVLMILATALMPHDQPMTAQPAVPPIAQPLDVFVHSIVINDDGMRFNVVLVNHLNEPIEVSRWSVRSLLKHRCRAIGDPTNPTIIDTPAGVGILESPPGRNDTYDQLMIPARSSIALTFMLDGYIVPDVICTILEKDPSILLEGNIPKALRGNLDDTYMVRSTSRPMIWKP
jgi:hypothetical protein